MIAARHWITCCLGVCVLGSSCQAPAQQQSAASQQVKQKTSTEFVLEAGSPEASALQQWLLDNAPRQDGVLLVDTASMGDLHVQYTASTSRSHGSAAHKIPSLPTPDQSHQGNGGDTYIISTCSTPAAISQVWKFVWEDGTAKGTWANVSYMRKQVSQCSTSNA